MAADPSHLSLSPKVEGMGANLGIVSSEQTGETQQALLMGGRDDFNEI